MGARRLTCRVDSRLVVGQMNGEYQMKDDHLLRYFHRANALTKEFERFILRHIPQEENALADMLFKLSSEKEKGHLTSIIRQVLSGRRWNA